MSLRDDYFQKQLDAAENEAQSFRAPYTVAKQQPTTPLPSMQALQPSGFQNTQQYTPRDATLGDAVQAGVEKTFAGIDVAKASISEMLGGNPYENIDLMNKAEKSFERANRRLTAKPMEEWQDFGDFGQALKETFGQSLPGIAAIAATSLIGRKATQGLMKTLAKKFDAKQAGSIGGWTGGLVGSAIATGPQMAEPMATNTPVRASWEEAYVQDRTKRLESGQDVFTLKPGEFQFADGDSGVMADGTQFRIKGLNTADEGQVGKAEAAQYMQNLAANGMRFFDTGDVDKYGRHMIEAFDMQDNQNSLAEKLYQAGQAGPIGSYKFLNRDYRLTQEGQKQEGALPYYSNRFTDQPTDLSQVEFYEPATDTDGNYSSLSDQGMRLLAGSAVTGGLNLIPFAAVLNPLPKEVKNRGLRMLLKGLEAGAAESVTENAENVVTANVLGMTDKDIKYLGEDTYQSILETTALSFPLGFAMGALGGIPGSKQYYMDKAEGNRLDAIAGLKRKGQFKQGVDWRDKKPSDNMKKSKTFKVQGMPSSGAMIEEGISEDEQEIRAMTGFYNLRGTDYARGVEQQNTDEYDAQEQDFEATGGATLADVMPDEVASLATKKAEQDYEERVKYDYENLFYDVPSLLTGKISDNLKILPKEANKERLLEDTDVQAGTHKRYSMKEALEDDFRTAPRKIREEETIKYANAIASKLDAMTPGYRLRHNQAVRKWNDRALGRLMQVRYKGLEMFTGNGGSPAQVMDLLHRPAMYKFAYEINQALPKQERLDNVQLSSLMNTAELAKYAEDSLAKIKNKDEKTRLSNEFFPAKRTYSTDKGRAHNLVPQFQAQPALFEEYVKAHDPEAAYHQQKIDEALAVIPSYNEQVKKNDYRYSKVYTYTDAQTLLSDVYVKGERQGPLVQEDVRDVPISIGDLKKVSRPHKARGKDEAYKVLIEEDEFRRFGKKAEQIFRDYDSLIPATKFNADGSQTGVYLNAASLAKLVKIKSKVSSPMTAFELGVTELMDRMQIVPDFLLQNPASGKPSGIQLTKDNKFVLAYKKGKSGRYVPNDFTIDYPTGKKYFKQKQREANPYRRADDDLINQLNEFRNTLVQHKELVDKYREADKLSEKQKSFLKAYDDMAKKGITPDSLIEQVDNFIDSMDEGVGGAGEFVGVSADLRRSETEQEVRPLTEIITRNVTVNEYTPDPNEPRFSTLDKQNLGEMLIAHRKSIQDFVTAQTSGDKQAIAEAQKNFAITQDNLQGYQDIVDNIINYMEEGSPGSGKDKTGESHAPSHVVKPDLKTAEIDEFTTEFIEVMGEKFASNRKIEKLTENQLYKFLKTDPARFEKELTALKEKRMGGFYIAPEDAVEAGLPKAEYIYVAESETKEDALSKVSHEVAHSVVYNHWNKASDALKKRIFDAWVKWLKARHPERYEELINDPKFNELYRSSSMMRDPTHNEKFAEWLANEISAWIMTDKKPKSLLSKWFNSIASAITNVFRVLGVKTVDRSVNEFMNNIWVKAQSGKEKADGVKKKAKRRAGRFKTAGHRILRNKSTDALEVVVAKDLSSNNMITQMKAFMLAYDTFLSSTDRNILMKAIGSGPVARQVEKYLMNNTRLAWKDYQEDDRMKVAYTVALWKMGHIELGPRSKGVVNKMLGEGRKTLGIVTREDQAAQIMNWLWQSDKDELRKKRSDIYGMNEIHDPEQLEHTWVQKKFARIRKPLESAIKTLGKLGLSERQMSSSHPVIQRMINLVARDIYATTKGGGYEERKNHKLAGYNNMIAEAIEPLVDDPIKMSTFIKIMNTPNPYSVKMSSEMRETVKAVRRVMDDIYKYTGEAGLKFGYLKNYWPFVMDSVTAMNNRDSLVGIFYKYMTNQAVQQKHVYNSKTGRTELKYDKNIKPTEALKRKKAEMIVDGLIKEDGFGDLSENGIETDGRTPYFGAIEPRALKFITDNRAAMAELNPYLEQNASLILHRYAHQAVKRAEYERIKPELERLSVEAYKSGATIEEINEVYSLLNGVLGIKGAEEMRKRPVMNKIIQGATVLTNMAILSTSGISNMADIGGVFVRSPDMVEGLRSLTKGFDKKTRLVAEDIGAIEESTLNGLFAGGYDTTFLSGGFKKMNDVFFHVIGMHKVAAVTRTMGVALAERMFKMWSEDPKSYVREMAEMGLEKKDLVFDKDGYIVRMSFAEQSKLRSAIATYEHRLSKAKTQKQKDSLTKQIGGMRAKLEQAERVDLALNRFVNSAMLKPSAASKPAWGNDARFKIFFLLKGFMYQFWDTYHRRAYYAARYDQDWSAAMGMMTFVPIFIMVEALRDALQHLGDDDPWKAQMTEEEWMNYHVQRSGVLGIMEPLFSMKDDIVRGQAPVDTVFGPVAGSLWDAVIKAADNDIDSWIEDMTPFQNLFGPMLKSLEN
jgi:hypothetical protein